jgi:hypothetical protein
MSNKDLVKDFLLNTFVPLEDILDSYNNDRELFASDMIAEFDDMCGGMDEENPITPDDVHAAIAELDN